MIRMFLISVFSAAFAMVPLYAEPKAKKPQPILPPAPPVQGVSPAIPRLIEFQGDDISSVLRTLARSAKLNMVISDGVTGTVTMRIEDKTPREAIETIAAAKDLILDEKRGVLYVRPKNPAPLAPPKPPEAEKPLNEALSELFTPALNKFYDSILDYHARPETAQKIARGKKALYDALLVEGFTKDEAFRLILAPNQELTIPDANK